MVINLGWIVELTLRYLVLVSVAIVVALLVSVPVGWLANRWRLGREGLIALVGALYAIPSLPMFTVIPIITGAPIRSTATVVVITLALVADLIFAGGFAYTQRRRVSGPRRGELCGRRSADGCR
ncbi:hypothetical protein [Trueperella pecoris]|uniref:hypothetical protein n=1 Tax=Trueperella pecoris TaxID=2733571 RepID=UPI00186B7B6B|nr:hypothetical protein [Trueperella pecoris]QOQ38256.1 hypothetical protein HLG82_01565 [Trueperella pecoris]